MANLTGDAFEFDQCDSDISRRVLEWNNKFCIVLVGDVAGAALPGQGRAQGQAKGSNGGSGGMQMFDFLQWHPVAAASGGDGGGAAGKRQCHAVVAVVFGPTALLPCR